MPPIALQPDLAGKLDVVGIGMKVLSRRSSRRSSLPCRAASGIVASALIFSLPPATANVVMQPWRRRHEGLHMKAGDDAELTCHLRADLAMGCEPVRGP